MHEDEDEQRDGISYLAKTLVEWHRVRKEKIMEIVESSKDGKPIKLDLNGEETELTDDKLSGFRVGLVAALAIIGELPFSLEPPEDEPEDEPEPDRPADFGHFS